MSVDETDSARKSCHFCGAVYSEGQRECMSCGASLPATLSQQKTRFRSGKKPAKLTDFNFGAFLIPVFWTIGHRLWGYAALLIGLLIINVGVPILALVLGPIALLPMILIMLIRLGFAIYLGINGSQLAWNKARLPDVDNFLKMQRSWAIAGVITVGFFSLYSVYVKMPDFKRARAKSNFTACAMQLRNISSGMEYHISETGTLNGIKDEDDICHHVIPGYHNPKNCAGMIRKKTDEICQTGSLDVRALDASRYEIRAKASDKTQCNICVTESEMRPAEYDPTGACRKFTCVHGNK